MIKNNLNKKIDYKFSQYYTNCDFINRYNLESFQKMPVIQSIVLEVGLERIVDSFFLKYKFDTETLQSVSFLIFYIISALLPFINFSKSKSIHSGNNNYALKIVYKKQSDIYSFLHDVYGKFRLKLRQDIKNLENSFVLTQLCKFDCFFELENIFQKYVKIINVKELYFNLHIKIVNATIQSKKTLLKNFLFLDK